MSLSISSSMRIPPLKSVRINSNDSARAKRTAHRNRNGIHEGAVDEPTAIRLTGRTMPGMAVRHTGPGAARPHGRWKLRLRLQEISSEALDGQVLEVIVKPIEEPLSCN